MKIEEFFNVSEIINESLLEENMLSSDFKFGFELEGYLDLSKQFSEYFLYEQIPASIDYIQSIIEDAIADEDEEMIIQMRKATSEIEKLKEFLSNGGIITKEVLSKKFKELNETIIELDNVIINYNDTNWVFRDVDKVLTSFYGNGGDLKDDESIDTPHDICVSFEYASPPIKFSPLALKNLESCLQRLIDVGVKTNDSCGFHIHFSFPSMVTEDAVWMLCQLALNEEMKNTFKALDIVKLTNYAWADDEFLNNIKICLNKNNFKALEKYCYPTSKLNSFKIHEQGTIEWRGPRGFVGNSLETHAFLSKLFKMVHWISLTKSMKYITVGKSVMEKSVFFNKLENISQVEFNSPTQTRINTKNISKLKNLATKFSNTLDVNVLYQVKTRADAECFVVSLMDIIDELPIDKHDKIRKFISNIIERDSGIYSHLRTLLDLVF